MSFQHKITTAYADETSQPAGTQISIYTGSQIDGVDTSIPAGSTDLLVAANWKQAGIQSQMWSAPDGALTVKINTTTTPPTTLTLAAGQTLTWGHDYTAANPVPEDVTALYVTNSGSAAARFKVRVLTT